MGGLCCGTLAQPEKSAPETRNPKHWRGVASVPRSFILYQVVEGVASLLEVCIGAIGADEIHEVRGHGAGIGEPAVCISEIGIRAGVQQFS